MKLDISAALNDALATWRREHALLLRIAWVFLFLPGFASDMLGPTIDRSVKVGTPEAAEAAAHYYVAAAPWMLGATLVTLFGSATLFALLRGGGQTPADAMRRAAQVYGYLLLAEIAYAVLLLGGLLMFIIPGLYLAGRLLVLGPVVVVERRGPIESLTRTAELTRNHGWVLFAISAGLWLTGYVCVSMVSELETVVTAAAGSSPILTAIFSALAAAVAMIFAVAMVLLKVAIYRRLAV